MPVPISLFLSSFISTASRIRLDYQGHISKSAQTAMIFLVGRERRSDRQ